MRDDIHALSGAYAIDALDDIERAQFEQHLAACGTCQNEVASLREAAAVLAEATVMAPSAQLRERVLAGISTVRPLPPVLAPGAHRAESSFRDDTNVTPIAPHRRRRAASFLAAAAAVVAIGTGGVVWHAVSNDDQPSSVAAQVMTAPDHQTYTQQLADGVTATVYRSQKLDKAVLVTHGFPLAQSGKEYALWLLHGKAAVAAGVLPSSANNRIVLNGDAANATAAGITVEDAGSTPTTPSGPMVANIDFKET